MLQLLDMRFMKASAGKNNVFYVICRFRRKKQPENEDRQKGIFKMISGIANAVVMFLLVLMGGIPVLYLTLSIPVVVVWKIYRKIKYGYTLYD